MENNQTPVTKDRTTNAPRRKLIGGLIVLAVLSAVFALFLQIINVTVNIGNDREAQNSRVSELKETIEKQIGLLAQVEADIEKSRLTGVVITSAANQKTVEEHPDKVPCMLDKGAIIKVSGNSCALPKDFPKDVQIDASLITSDSGTITPDMQTSEDNEDEDGGAYYIYYSKITGPYYYIEWIDYDTSLESQSKMFDFEKSMSGIEKALNVNFLLFTYDPVEDSGHKIVYSSESLPGMRSAEEYGITEEMLSHVAKKQDTQTAEDISETFSMLTIDDAYYEMFLQEYNSPLMDQKMILAYLIPYDSTLRLLNEQTLIILGTFIILGVFFLIRLSFTWRLVKEHTLNDSQKAELGPRSIIKKTFASIGIGCVIILVLSALMVSLFRLFQTCQQVEGAFSSLRQQIEENASQARLTESFRKETYESYVRRIAGLLQEHPEYAGISNLQAICDLIEADYIMLFDQNGDETMSNSRYVGLSLGTTSASSTYEFRNLLTGTELITHDLAVDEATGEEHVMIGASFGDPAEGGHYEALLVAIPGEKIYGSTEESIDDILSSLVTKDMIAYSVDPETNLIVHASDEDMIGNNALSMGLPEQALNDGYRDFFNMNSISWYGECAKIDSSLYFYAAKQSSIYLGVLEQSVTAAVAAFILLSVLAGYLLLGYRKFFDTWSQSGKELSDKMDEIRGPGGKRKYSIDPSKRWKFDTTDYGIRTPLHIAKTMTKALLLIILIVLGIRVLSAENSIGASLLSYILRGQWTKGVNLFAFTSILILFGEITVITAAVKFLLRLISSAIGTKGETLCRLFINLTGYVGMIVFLYFSLYYLGFQPGTLLASLGLLSFAISLGAKDLITDIIAGLSIVFDGEYQVGDIIDVGGYRGEVLEIGVRTTKLEGRGGNIKIIGNRDVKNVVNMTRKSSWYPLEISIPANQPLQEIEALLTEQLPHIGEADPKILSGPFYRGVTSITKGTMTLSIIAECNEGDYFAVQRSVNRAIQKLCEEKGITLV